MNENTEPSISKKDVKPELIEEPPYLPRDAIRVMVLSSGRSRRAAFQCPIPKVYYDVVNEIEYSQLAADIIKIAEDINEEIKKREKPFDIFPMRHIPDSFPLSNEQLNMPHLQIDDNGLSGAWVGPGINSGDIYISTNEGRLQMLSDQPEFLKEYMNIEVGFRCHNVDNFTQAYVNRELCIRYFNYILHKAKELGIDPKGVENNSENKNPE